MNILKQYSFSIIIPNYNGGSFLEGCLKSILNQNYQNYEIIVVDGKSNDNSHFIIEKYMQLSNKIIWLKQKDRGISDGFNNGLNRAVGDFIIYLGSDDYLYEDILQKVNQYINHILDYNLLSVDEINIFCDSINYRSDIHDFEKRVFPSKRINRFNLIKYGTLVGLQNIFFNGKWIKNNRLDESNKYSMDYEVYFRMIEDNQKFIYFPEINSINYQGDNISRKFGLELRREAIEVGFKYSRGVKEKFFLIKKVILINVFKIFVFVKGLFKK